MSGGGLIASSVSAPFRRSSSEPNRTATTSLPAARSARTVIRVAGTPSGAPSSALIRLTIASIAARSASNVATRAYSVIGPLSFEGRGGAKRAYPRGYECAHKRGSRQPVPRLRPPSLSHRLSAGMTVGLREGRDHLPGQTRVSMTLAELAHTGQWENVPQ